MGFLTSLFLPGKRTITLSVIAGILGVLLQADAQGILTLTPLIKLIFQLGLTMTLPLIPVFLRKGIENSLNKGAKK